MAKAFANVIWIHISHIINICKYRCVFWLDMLKYPFFLLIPFASSNDLVIQMTSKKIKKKLPAIPGFLCSPGLRLVKGRLRSIVEVVQVWIQMLHLTSQIDELLRDTVFREKNQTSSNSRWKSKIATGNGWFKKQLRWRDINFESEPIFRDTSSTLKKARLTGSTYWRTVLSSSDRFAPESFLWRKVLGARKKEIKI